MSHDAVLEWLLAGDAAVRFQATRDLLHRDATALQRRVATEGDAATILAARHPDGHGRPAHAVVKGDRALTGSPTRVPSRSARRPGWRSRTRGA